MVCILVCRLCDNSIAHETSEPKPERCPLCKDPAHWRVADDNELTPSDRRFLRLGLIAAD